MFISVPFPYASFSDGRGAALQLGTRMVSQRLSAAVLLFLIVLGCARSDLHMPKVLFLAGSLVFTALGLAHGLLTLRDLRTPRSFAPTDDHVRLAMIDGRLRLAPQTSIWRSWLGFNLSHSLGLVVFGGLLTVLALQDFALVARNGFLEGGAVVVAILYFWMALRFWFWLPAAVSGAGAACFVVSALSS